MGCCNESEARHHKGVEEPSTGEVEVSYSPNLVSLCPHRMAAECRVVCSFTATSLVSECLLALAGV
jgi:hypothetical protein